MSDRQLHSAYVTAHYHPRLPNDVFMHAMALANFTSGSKSESPFITGQ